MPGSRGAALRAHLPYLGVIAGLALAWTWPLAIHWRTHVPGLPGDNFSFLWNLWWMRHVLGSTGGLAFFHSTFLMFPFGIDIVDHPHTALQGVVSATMLSRLSIVEAENLYIVASMFLNGAAAYALAFDIARSRRGALLAAVAFGGSPYIGAHLLGHFDLLSAWVIPAFAVCWRRALRGGHLLAAIGCGVLVAVAAYTAYYYVVYLALFAIVYTLVTWRCAQVDVARRAPSRSSQWIGRAAAVLWCVTVAVILWVLWFGSASVGLGGARLVVRHTHNPMTLAWLLAAIWLWARWRPQIHLARPAPGTLTRSLRLIGVTVAVFGLCAAPLVLEAIRLARSGGYVSQVYFWRSAPRGVDLAMAAVGSPFHPLIGRVVSQWYQAAGVDRIEGVAWLGIVPMALLFLPRGPWRDRDEARHWKVVAGAFGLWALGPFLTIAGFDVGLPLPQSLMRFLPLVANARMPGRAMVVVYLALGVLMALRLATLGGRWQRPAVQWALIGGLAFDYLNAPIPLTSLDRPTVYARLAAITDDGPLIELPFGIGDGLSGFGNQDRSILWYATMHEHPLVGGFIGRMPPGIAEAYQRMPIVGNLLRLSSGQPVVAEPVGSLPPFRYVVVNTATASPALMAYAHSVLNLDLLAAGEGRALYAVR